MNVGLGLGVLLGPSLKLMCRVQESKETESAKESSFKVGMGVMVLMIRLSSNLQRELKKHRTELVETYPWLSLLTAARKGKYNTNNNCTNK